MSDNDHAFTRRDLPMLAFLGGLTSLTAIAVDISLPAIPELARQFAVDPATTHAIVSLFLLGYGLMQPIYGPLSDQVGRKSVLLAGLALFTAASLLSSFAEHISTLYLLRFLQGMGAGCGPVLARAILRDRFSGTGAERAMALVMFAMAFGPLIAPTIGGLLVENHGVGAVFWALTILALLFLTVTALWYTETASGSGGTFRPLTVLSSYREVLSHPIARWDILAGGFIYAAMLCYISASPAVLIEGFGASPRAYGYYFAMSAGALLVGSLVNSRLLKRLPSGTCTLIGLALALTGGGAMLALAAAGQQEPLAVVLPTVILVFGLAIVLPNSTARAMQPFGHQAGTASAAIGSVHIALGVVAGYVTGLCFDGTALPLGIALSLCALLAGAAFLQARRTTNQTMAEERHAGH